MGIQSKRSHPFPCAAEAVLWGGLFLGLLLPGQLWPHAGVETAGHGEGAFTAGYDSMDVAQGWCQ